MQKNRLLFVLFAIALAGMLMYGCNGSDNPVGSGGTEDIPVNPAYAENPPVAETVSIRKVEGSDTSVDLLVRFKVGTITDSLFAVDNDGVKVIFRDNGKNGDANARDGIYTTRIKTTPDEIRSLLQDSQTFSAKKSGKMTQFDGRTIISRSIPQQRHDWESFSSGNLMDFTVAPSCSKASFDTIKSEHQSLMITDLAVVQDPLRTFNVTAPAGSKGDPHGVWTFWELMKQLASHDPAHIATDAQTSDFILAWLNTWNTPQSVNGETIPARININSKIIDSWRATPEGPLVPEKTPFRLTAIVNRLDLRTNQGYGGGRDAGEGRFIFCATRDLPLLLTVIFEFGINRSGCTNVKNYARQWYSLKDAVIGSPAYNNSLNTITSQFSQCGTNTARVNQSSLNQLRTNEISLGPFWELREFQLGKTPSTGLHPVTVKRTPAAKYGVKTSNADVREMAKWINSKETSYLIAKDNGINLPDTFPSSMIPFVGGHAPYSAAVFWDANPFPGIDSIHDGFVRHYFSLNTCSGCHARETETRFTHVSPAAFGTEASLSGFLTGAGMPVSDPSHRIPDFAFSDLERRAVDLDKLVSCQCGGVRGLLSILFFRTLGNVH